MSKSTCHLKTFVRDHFFKVVSYRHLLYYWLNAFSVCVLRKSRFRAPPRRGLEKLRDGNFYLLITLNLLKTTVKTAVKTGSIFVSGQPSSISICRTRLPFRINICFWATELEIGDSSSKAYPSSSHNSTRRILSNRARHNYNCNFII